MNRLAAKFLQGLVVLLGLVALALLLWEPQLEGRNLHASQFEIYFRDPFLACAYLASLPFFLALYRAFRILGLAARQRLRSPETIDALRSIRHCAFAIIGFVALGEVFILLHESDDRAGGVALGVLVTLGSVAVALASAAFERFLRPTPTPAA